MNKYCDFYINDNIISRTKKIIDPRLLSLFPKEAFKIYQREMAERKRLLDGLEKYLDYAELAIEYSSSAKVIRENLNIQGFSIKYCFNVFENNLRNACNYLKQEVPLPYYSYNQEEKINALIEILQEIRVGEFIDAAKVVFNNQYFLNKSLSKNIWNGDPLYSFIVHAGLELTTILNIDPRVLLRILVEDCASTDVITYDLTDAIEVDEIMDFPEIYDHIIEAGALVFNIKDKTIILTEGSNDIYALQNALRILYPYLTKYYTFMDFGLSNAEGSASSLVSSVKSFIGASINNKIIALFDNDTAAYDAVRGLNRTQIPSNIKILHYPNLELAKSYPTIGPTGNATIDINGLACSIELYLGKEILSDGTTYTPVHWKGYNQTLRRYQGEILNKQVILKKFNEKIKICSENPDSISNYDWSGLDLILQSIFNAFNLDENIENART